MRGDEWFGLLGGEITAVASSRRSSIFTILRCAVCSVQIKIYVAREEQRTGWSIQFEDITK